MSGMMIASPIGVAFDKSKGSMGNRVDCAKEHYGNNLTAGLKTDAVILAGAGVITLMKMLPLTMDPGLYTGYEV